VQLVFLVLGSRHALGMLLCVVVRSYSVFKHGCVSAYMHCDSIAEHMLVVFRTHQWCCATDRLLRGCFVSCQGAAMLSMEHFAKWGMRLSSRQIGRRASETSGVLDL
jgi:hypothetical protein